MKTDEKKIRYTVAKRKTGKEQQQQQQSLVSVILFQQFKNQQHQCFIYSWYLKMERKLQKLH